MNRDEYKSECRQRWSGGCLQDAYENWHHFEAFLESLTEAMRQYLHNPCLEDFSGKCHSDGTLTQFLWNLQKGWYEPDMGSLWPLLDFCDHYQKVHLRRGLIIYCKQILRDIETPQEQDDAQLCFL